MTQATHVDVGKVGCSPDITVTDLEPVGGDHRECSPDIRRRKVHFPTPHLSARAGVAQTCQPRAGLLQTFQIPTVE